MVIKYIFQDKKQKGFDTTRTRISKYQYRKPINQKPVTQCKFSRSSLAWNDPDLRYFRIIFMKTLWLGKRQLQFSKIMKILILSRFLPKLGSPFFKNFRNINLVCVSIGDSKKVQNTQNSIKVTRTTLKQLEQSIEEIQTSVADLIARLMESIVKVWL